MVALPFGPPDAAAPKLTDAAKTELQTLLEGLGYRELGAAYLFGAGLRLAPTLDDKLVLLDQANEELSHFEVAAATYGEAGLGDLLAVVAPRTARIPEPKSWIELVIAQVLFDRASCLQVKGHEGASYAPYSQMVAKIAQEEERHLAACEATFREAFAARPDALAGAQEHVVVWLRVALEAFGRPFHESPESSPLGLSLETADVMREYLKSVAVSLRDVGLRLPTRDELGLDLPADLPLA